MNSQDPAARKVEKALRAGTRLADLIEALLDVSRIATGRLTLRPERFDLAEAASDVVERFHDSAVQAGCSVSLETRAPVLGVWDRLRVEQILGNLLSNATRYAPGVPVTVTVQAERDHAVVEVRDQGPGVRGDALARIFERFERASSAVAGGMGLGLYIARQFAEAQGGSVTARNLDGGGACFTVRLPLAPHAR